MPPIPSSAPSAPAIRVRTLPARLRIAARLAKMALALLIALPLHGLWRLFRLRSPWPPIFLGWIARAAGVRIRIVGTPLKRDVLLLSNHVSWLDILVIAGSSGSAFVAKGELGAAPVLGWLCRLNHTIFVDRGDRLGVARQVEKLRGALAAEHPVTIFPEGTTDGGGTQLLPFKAALIAAIDPPPPGLSVQPVFIDYGEATSDVAWIGTEPGTDNAFGILARPGRLPVTVRYMEPFDPTGLGRKAVAERARASVLAAMMER